MGRRVPASGSDGSRFNRNQRLAVWCPFRRRNPRIDGGTRRHRVRDAAPRRARLRAVGPDPGTTVPGMAEGTSMKQMRVENEAKVPASTTATLPLFRREVLAARQEQAVGALLLVQPISTTLL